MTRLFKVKAKPNQSSPNCPNHSNETPPPNTPEQDLLDEGVDLKSLAFLADHMEESDAERIFGVPNL